MAMKDEQGQHGMAGGAMATGQMPARVEAAARSVLPGMRLKPGVVPVIPVQHGPQQRSTAERALGDFRANQGVPPLPLRDPAPDLSGVPAVPGVTPTDESLMQSHGLRRLGTGQGFGDTLNHLLLQTPLFSGLTPAESLQVASVMQIYAASPGQTLITEGEQGRFMLLVMSGEVEVVRRDDQQVPVQIAVARPGQTLGEMSMVDGAPRFASCIALDHCRLAMLSLESMQSLLRREPVLGNKILLKLVSMLSARLRETSAQLVNYLGAERSLN